MKSGRGMKDLSPLLISILALIPNLSACEDVSENSAIYKACPGVEKWDSMQNKDSGGMENSITPTKLELRQSILVLALKDQAARERFSSDSADINAMIKVLSEVDASNLKAIQTIVRNSGVPSLAEVGKDGMEAFWLIVQHAGGDPAFQEEMLTALSAPNSGIDRSELAMLMDQVRVARGLPQIYGTQFRQVDGKFVPYEIADASRVDALRATHDLMPLSDYVCVLKKTYKP